MTTTLGWPHPARDKVLAVTAIVALLASLAAVFAAPASADDLAYLPGDSDYNQTDWWEDYLDVHDDVTDSACTKIGVESASDYVADADYRLVIVKKGAGEQANRLYWNVSEGDVLAPGPNQGDGKGYSHVIVCTNSWTPGEETTTTQGTTTTGEETTTTGGETTTTSGETTTTGGTTPTIPGALPQIEVSKTADLPTVAPGTDVTFTIVISNPSDSVAVTIKSIQDSVYGVLDGDDDCEVGITLAPLVSCEFTFTRQIDGADGTNHENVVTVVGSDDQGSEVNDHDNEIVAIRASTVSPVTLTPTTLPTEVKDVEVLPFTGFESGVLVAGSLLLLMGGLGLVRATHKRAQG